MKTFIFVLSLSAALFSTDALSKEHSRNNHSPKQQNHHVQKKHVAAKQNRHNTHQNIRKNNGNRHVVTKVISHHDRRNALVGGLILGSLIHHTTHSQHRNMYWEDDYGSCYRVENRPQGDVYVEVPHNKCH